jgi:hypothetical protein
VPVNDSDFSEFGEELIEGELLEAESRRDVVVRRVGELAPAVKAAAVVGAGVAVGAATAVVVAKASGKQVSRLGNGRRSGRVEAIESTTSYLIDIHRLVRQ